MPELEVLAELLREKDKQIERLLERAAAERQELIDRLSPHIPEIPEDTPTAVRYDQDADYWKATQNGNEDS